MNYPFLSIITTSFNRRDLLKKTLDSVLAQTYPNVEQLVFDAASSDGTADLLKSYEQKFAAKKYEFRWVSEKDSGQGEAMNKALAVATGDFVMILNSDDFLEDDSLAVFMNGLAREPKIDLLYGDHFQIFADGTKRRIGHRLYSLDDVVQRGYQIPQSSAIFRRSLLMRTGNFNTLLKVVAEHDLFVRMLRAGARAKYITEPLQTTLEHDQRKSGVLGLASLEETRRVNFSHGARYASRFYVLYLKERYTGGLFQMIKKHAPRLHASIKRIFQFITSP
jgi:glycosyltransferase involved in cell wall biosynthesis